MSLRGLKTLLTRSIVYFEKPFVFVENNSHILLWLLVGASTLFFSLGVRFTYVDLAGQANPFDKAIMYQLFWNTLHGHFFYSSILERYYFAGGTGLIFILIFPIYAIYPNMISLTVVSAFIISLGALPIYRLTKQKFRNGTAGLVLAIAYLIFPALSFMYLENVKDEIFSITPLLFTFYYYEKGDFKKFLGFAFISMLCKRNITLVIIMFGIHALIVRKKSRWVLAPILLGSLCFLVYLYVIIPYFYNLSGLAALDISAGVFTPARYEYLGGTFSQIARTVITNPLLVLKEIMTRSKMFYLFLLFLPLGFLPLARPKILLITFPIFMENLLSTFPPQYSIQFHYSAAIVPFLILATIYAIEDVRRRISRRRLERTILAILLLFVMACSIYSAVTFGAEPAVLSRILLPTTTTLYENTGEAKSAWNLIRMIPENASVSADIRLAPALSQRERLNLFPIKWVGFDYVLINPSSPIQVSEEEYDRAVYAVLNDSDYHILAIESPYVLLKHGETGVTDEADLKLLLDPHYKMFAEDPLIDHPARLNFLRAYSKQGWYGKEAWGGQFDFVWAGGSENHSSMRMILPIEKCKYVLAFRAAPISYIFEGLPMQTVKVYVNGMFLEEISLFDGWSTYRIPVPISYTVSGVNEIEFVYGYTASPFLYTHGRSGDTRELAVAFDYIELFPAEQQLNSSFSAL